MGKHALKKLVIEKRGNCCEECKLDSWNDSPISLELHRINGTEYTEDNVKLLCPNCHAKTDTYRGKNIKGKYNTIQDDKVKELAESGKYELLSDLLVALGLVPCGGNYRTLRNKLTELGLLEKFSKKPYTILCKACKEEFITRKCDKRQFCSKKCSNFYNRGGTGSYDIRPPDRCKGFRPDPDKLLKLVETFGQRETSRILKIDKKTVVAWLKEDGNYKRQR